MVFEVFAFFCEIFAICMYRFTFLRDGLSIKAVADGCRRGRDEGILSGNTFSGKNIDLERN